MRARPHKVFLVLSALGYGFLGCGPSLWALDVRPPDRILDCLEMGCTCRMHPGQKGALCCCIRNRTLIAKFPSLAKDPGFWKALGLDPPRPPGTCQIQPDGCDLPGGHGMGPVPSQAHFPRMLSFNLLLPLHRSRPNPIFVGSSNDPDAPLPRPG
ncbi:MAG: hypothetical protein ACREKE_08390 [bacterium]